MTRIAVTPTAKTHPTEEASRIARALSHVRNVLARASEKEATAATNASRRLHRSASRRAVARARIRVGRPSASALTVSVCKMPAIRTGAAEIHPRHPVLVPRYRAGSRYSDFHFLTKGESIGPVG